MVSKENYTNKIVHTPDQIVNGFYAVALNAEHGNYAHRNATVKRKLITVAACLYICV